MSYDCGPNINHAVILVGYGKDLVSGLDYWLVRNSWGVSWGEAGYIRLKRTATGAIDGMLNYSSYATIVVG